MSEEAVSSIDCALRVLAPISGNTALAPELRARAQYLAGNLEMLRSQYDAAVASYDLALLLTPGVSKEAQKKAPFKDIEVDPLGLWIADNRALALRLQREKEEQEKQKEEENQSNQEEEPKDEGKPEDEQQDGEPKDDSQEEKDGDQSEEEKDGDQGEKDEPKDPEEQEDPEKKDGDSEPKDDSDPSDSSQQSPSDSSSSPDAPEEAAAENQPSEARDQRMLDLLEQAPTLQKHDAEKRKAQGVRFRSTMEDK